MFIFNIRKIILPHGFLTLMTDVLYYLLKLHQVK